MPELSKKHILYTTISNGKGMSVTISNLGADIISILVPDRDGNISDVALGFDDPESYLANPPSFGALVGPYANRIEGASFTLEGRTYHIEANEGKNTLHSGSNPFHHRFYDIVNSDSSSVTLRLFAPDGDSGFPGNREVTVKYEVTVTNSLSITYHAESDALTPMNLTNHSYFNLNGHDSGSISDHIVWIDSDSYTVTDEHSIPHGEIAPLDATPLDFRTPKKIGERIDCDFPPMVNTCGYDQNYVLKTERGKVDPVASLYSEKSGRKMTVYTDMPGLQLYSGNFIPSAPLGKGGVHYCRRAGVAMETQFFPNAINVPSFMQPLVSPDKPFDSTTIYQFSTL